MRKILSVVLVISAGCISTAEYKAFVASSRAYYTDVSPRNTASIASDNNLSAQSKKNRTQEDHDYGAAISAVEERLGIAAAATPVTTTAPAVVKPTAGK
jgi:hypothetical protein